MTEKQKAARMDNLAKGRKKRAEMLKQKKEGKVDDNDETSYDDSSSNSSSDSEAFTLSKVKRSKKVPVKETKSRKQKNDPLDRPYSRQESDELKQALIEVLNMQKKQNKTVKRQSKRPAGNVIVNVPQASGAGAQPQVKTYTDHELQMRKSLGMPF